MVDDDPKGAPVPDSEVGTVGAELKCSSRIYTCERMAEGISNIDRAKSNCQKRFLLMKKLSGFTDTNAVKKAGANIA